MKITERKIIKSFKELIGKKPYPYQLEILKGIGRGENIFGVFATGSGKSMCFQVPAYIQDGLTLVISPLIALMHDHAYQCNKMGIKAACITSAVPAPSVKNMLKNLNDYSIIFIAPERLKSVVFLRALRRASLNLIVLDEMHENVKSGLDFRPAYSLISSLVKHYVDSVPFMGLTATADTEVEREFKRTLDGASYQRMITLPHRDNLNYKVVSEVAPRALVPILAPLQDSGDSAIVYCNTRRMCNDLSYILSHYGINCAAYHGGMNSVTRNTNQDGWMDGSINTMIATNAFGMGINKSNVRVIFHYMEPGSLFAYLQESGRAGRDHKQADCYLNLSKEGARIQKYFIRMQNPPYFLYQDIWNYLKKERIVNVTFNKLARECNVRRGDIKQLESAINFMEYSGCIKVEKGVKYYKLRVLNQSGLRQYANAYHLKVKNRLLKLYINPGQPDPVADLVARGIVAHGAPYELYAIQRTKRHLKITEGVVDAKLEAARVGLRQLHQFAQKEDKVAYLNEVFLKRSEVEV